jgi:hypothetical protein
MQSILQFIKDWIPSIGVIVAGTWILFKWLYEEKLRQKKEMPSLDGKLTITSIPLGENKKLLTVEALWNNRSPLPVYMDFPKCRIEIYTIPPDLKLPNGGLTLKTDLGDPLICYYFLLPVVTYNYFLEPNTESIIINHFVLQPGVYGIRMVLQSYKKEEIWWKEIIVNVQ